MSLKVCLNVKQLKKEFNEIESGTAGDVNFCASAALFIGTKLEAIESFLYQLTKQTMRMNTILLKKGKRNPSPYQLKVGRFLKEGKTIQEAHRLAKELQK